MPTCRAGVRPKLSALQEVETLPSAKSMASIHMRHALAIPPFLRGGIIIDRAAALTPMPPTEPTTRSPTGLALSVRRARQCSRGSRNVTD
jgi:hypothetical protein